MDRALLRRFPSLSGRLPWVPLGTFPTPVHRLEGLGVPDLWAKRDDLSDGVYGGNKVRKLELALARARQRGAERLWVHGGLGSNWVVACLLHAKPMGFAVDATLFETPLSEAGGRNLALIRARADSVEVWRGVLGVPAGAALHALRSRQRTEYLAPGGSGVLSTIGYVDAALELGEQVARGEAPRPTHVWVAHGSGGTAAGLLAGLAVLGWPTRVCAVQVNEGFIANRHVVLALARGALSRLAARGARGLPPIDPSRLVSVEGFLGAGYGAPTPEGDAAIERAHAAGIDLEPVYTGKTLAAILARCATLGPGPHLFWHTWHSGPLPDPGRRA